MSVAVDVAVGVLVGVSVAVCVGVAVGVSVGVGVAVGVSVGVCVGVGVTTASVSVAQSFADIGSTTGTGTETHAILLREPVALGSNVPMTLKVALPPTSKSMVVLRSPDPLVGQDDPAEALQVHETPVSVAGNVSVTVAPATSFGPLLVIVTRYVTPCPGLIAVSPSSLVRARSTRTGVFVGVLVGVCVMVNVAVLVGVLVAVLVAVCVEVGVGVAVDV